MGAWDATSFGNDTANDWAYDLEDYEDLAYLIQTLQSIFSDEEEYLEAPLAEEAIAAAEVIAWLRGHPCPVNAYTEKIAAWVAAHPIPPPSEVVQLALSALDRIEGPESELAELWEDDPDWTAAIANLRTRLTV